MPTNSEKSLPLVDEATTKSLSDHNPLLAHNEMYYASAQDVEDSIVFSIHRKGQKHPIHEFSLSLLEFSGKPHLIEVTTMILNSFCSVLNVGVPFDFIEKLLKACPRLPELGSQKIETVSFNMTWSFTWFNKVNKKYYRTRFEDNTLYTERVP